MARSNDDGGCGCLLLILLFLFIWTTSSDINSLKKELKETREAIQIINEPKEQ